MISCQGVLANITAQTVVARAGNYEFDNAFAQLIYIELALVSQCMGSGYQFGKGLVLCLAILHNMKPVYPEIYINYQLIFLSTALVDLSFVVLLAFSHFGLRHLPS